MIGAGGRLAVGLLAGVLLVGGTAGCRTSPQGRPPPQDQQEGITEEELRILLSVFSARATAVLRAGAGFIYEDSTDRSVQRSAIHWQLEMVPVVREAAFQEDPQEAFVDVLTLMVMLRQYLTTGEGREIFLHQQPRAIETARELEGEALRLGRNFLSEEELQRVHEEVEAFASRRPIRGDFVVQSMERALSDRERTGTLDWVVNIRMNPFRVFSDVSSGAAAVHEFNETAARFSQVVEDLPQVIRLQSQLLLLDLEDRQTVVQGLAALESSASSFQAVAASIERLPDEIAGLLGRTDATIAEANRALGSARELTGPLLEMAENLRLASASWEALLVRDEPPGPDQRPFDILEWQETAGEVGVAAGKLAGLVDRIEALMLEPVGEATPLANILSTVEVAETGAESVVDHAAWRGVQLLLLAFALGLAYRWLAPRLAPRGA